MADEGFKRKLIAILGADFEGYSCLMGDDEEATPGYSMHWVFYTEASCL